jgi:Pyruvate/2-oxoacid:ferredoxin oxidoreductase delta subunit
MYILRKCTTHCENGNRQEVMLKKEKTLYSSCVGCGICAAVCPRGVLKLEMVLKKEGLIRMRSY